MFPFEKIMIVTGNPSFDDPTKKDPKILKKFESVAAKQGLKFRQTGLYPPAYFPNRTPPHFEYRLYEGMTTSSSYEAINFDFTERKNALRIYSDIPEIKATPIINFIAKYFLHVQLEEDLSRATKRSFTMTAGMPRQRSRTTDEAIIEKLESIDNKLSNKKSIEQKDVVALIRDVRTADIDGVTSLDKAVNYIRHCKPEDERFYARSVAARQFVEGIAKAEAGGIDKRWGTLAQYAKKSDPEQRRKAKGKGKPHANAIPQGW